MDIWSPHLEAEFLEMYKNKKPFSDIRDTFVDRYPQWREYFSYYQLRS
jgi:hypothetical protein